jgi:hypothetical protein
LEAATDLSAEFYYTAGAVYLDNGQGDAARDFAIKAYDLGYPLPGLKRKLQHLGYWDD